MEEWKGEACRIGCSGNWAIWADIFFGSGLVQVRAHSENISSGQGSVPAKIPVRYGFRFGFSSTPCFQQFTPPMTQCVCMQMKQQQGRKKERKKRKTKEKKKDDPIRKSSTVSLYKDQCIREMIKAIEAGHAEGE